MGLRFMYLLLDWLATTPARVATTRRNRLLAAAPKRLPGMNGRSLSSHPSGSIHFTLRANPRANPGSELLEQALRGTLGGKS